jgi:hypothetical protein
MVSHPTQLGQFSLQTSPVGPGFFVRLISPFPDLFFHFGQMTAEFGSFLVSPGLLETFQAILELLHLMHEFRRHFPVSGVLLAHLSFHPHFLFDTTLSSFPLHLPLPFAVPLFPVHFSLPFSLMFPGFRVVPLCLRFGGQSKMRWGG